MFRGGMGASRTPQCLRNPQALMAVTSGANSGVVKTTTRSVTDIGHYKRVEYSHLHEAGGKSEKTRFLEKIKKLEEAADVKAKMGTVAEVHKSVEKPPGWKPVKLPDKVDKDATSVLKAMASVVGKDHTAPAYQYHDDPFLIPYNSFEKKTYLLAKDSGRKAARYILDNHPELFEKNLIEMVPKIKRYMPRVKVTAKSACPDLLMNYIQSSNVVQSVETYKLLEEKGDAEMVDTSLKQKLLELVCYHNASPELDEDSFRELWGTFDQPASIQEYSGFAETLVEEITVSTDATDEAKLTARLALACGYANHTTEGNVSARHSYVLDVYEELKLIGGDIDLNVFNNVILSFAKFARFTTASDIQDIIVKVNQILHDMKEKEVKPDVQTLCNYLKVTNALAFNKSIKSDQSLEKVAQSVMAEFKANLGVEPSLGCYYFYALSHRRSKVKTAFLDVLKVLEDNGAKIVPILKEDFQFFNGAIRELNYENRNPRALEDGYQPPPVPLEYFYKLHRVAVANQALLGDMESSFRYYNTFLLKLVESEKIDVAMDLWEQIVPHTVTPGTKVYHSALQMIAAQDGWKHLPRLWSDMLASNFNRSRMKDTYDLFAALVATICQSHLMEPAARATDEDHAMFQHFVSMSQVMTDRFLKETDDSPRRNPDVHSDRKRADAMNLVTQPRTIKFINQMLQIVSNKVLLYDEMVTADFQSQCRLVDFVIKHDIDMSGTLTAEPLRMALDNCIQEKNATEALKIIRYAALNQLESAMELATSVVTHHGVQLTEGERAQINSLFSYETKWVPV